MASPGLTCDGIRRVALEEMALRRRRLGELSPAQERALESLLVSVADNISDLISVVARGKPGRGPVEAASAPATPGPEEVGPARAEGGLR